MAMGRCHLSLRHHWHRPEADTGDFNCMRKKGVVEGWSGRGVGGGGGSVTGSGL